MATHDDGVKRTFSTGATRDTGNNKLDYDGFLSPLVLQRYAEYMHKNRVQSDGTLRDSDNWQKGIPQDVYRKSMWRHFMDVWRGHRGYARYSDSITREYVAEALCALLFNVMGLLHELQRDTERSVIDADGTLGSWQQAAAAEADDVPAPTWDDAQAPESLFDRVGHRVWRGVKPPR